MKRGTPRHPKVTDLAARLGVPVYSAVGLLEMLWHFTAEFALPGDIGRFPDDVIAKALCYDGASTMLVSCLHDAGWIDRCECHRLRVHDWPKHADQTVSRVLLKRAQCFLKCYDDPSMMLGSSKMPLPKAIAIACATGTPDGSHSQSFPSLKEFVAHMTAAGVSEDYATERWGRYDASGWVDARGVLIRRWKSLSASLLVQYRNDIAERQPASRPDLPEEQKAANRRKAQSRPVAPLPTLAEMQATAEAARPPKRYDGDLEVVEG